MQTDDLTVHELRWSMQMANMLEGGGKTPILAPEELQRLGFKLVAYPLSLLGVSMRAMQSALQLLKVLSHSSMKMPFSGHRSLSP